MRRFMIGMLLTASVVFAGSSFAAAPGKFVYTEEIQFPGGTLSVAFDEGGQKRFDSVGYRLDANVTVTTCQEGQCIAVADSPSATLLDLTPDAKGRVTGSLTLVPPPPGGGGICVCTSSVEYRDVTLTNLTSGHVYRLDATSADSA